MEAKHVFSKEGSTMNEKYLIGKDGVKPYIKDGHIAGYEFEVKIPYYMGVPLSQISHFKVYMDGVQEEAENIRFIMKTSEEFKLSEILTVSSYFWEYGELLRTVVLRDGGLTKGEHKLEVAIGIAVFYFPKDTTNKAYLNFSV